MKLGCMAALADAGFLLADGQAVVPPTPLEGEKPGVC